MQELEGALRQRRFGMFEHDCELCLVVQPGYVAQTLRMSTRKWIAIATGVAFAMAPVIVAFSLFPNDEKSIDLMGLSAFIGWAIGAPPALAIAGLLVFSRGPKGSKQRADARRKGIVLWCLGLFCVAVVIWIATHLGNHLCC